MPLLSWLCKDKIVGHHHNVPYRVLEHKFGYKSENPQDRSFTNSGNKIIHGDNLEALKSLMPEYEGRINCVYIDPPYNTGQENWIYNDNVNDPRILKWLGEVVGKEGEDLSRHDKWACMMYPRLQLLSKLMAEDASLVISIKHQELHSLILLCKEIFPTKQVVTVTVQTSGGKPSGGFNYLHEYLVFVVDESFEPNVLDFCGGIPRSPFEGLTLSTFNKTNRPNQCYPIFIDPETESIVDVGDSLQELIKNGLYKEEDKGSYKYDFDLAPEGTVAVWPITSKKKECVWRQKPTRLMEDWKKGYIKVSKNVKTDHPNRYSIQYLPEGIIKKIESGKLPILGTEQGKPTLILGTNETEGSDVPTIWTEKSFYTSKGTNALKEILPEAEKEFDYPKSPELIKAVLSAISRDEDIILDSFAGSGTTGQAVLSLNQENYENRHFILIELQDYADTITAERIRRVMSGYSYVGKIDETIYEKKLTFKDLKNVSKYVEEAEKAVEDNRKNYDKISRPKLDGDTIKVVATRLINGQMDGLGGSFDFYELGETIFNANGALNEQISIDKLREYIYYTETRQHLERPQFDLKDYLLDVSSDTAYYLYYLQDELSELNYETLSLFVNGRATNYIIYADSCLIDRKELALQNITFKKIPREISRF